MRRRSTVRRRPAGDSFLVQGAAGVADGRWSCLDLATGTARWSISAGNDYALTPLVVATNGIFTSAADAP